MRTCFPSKRRRETIITWNNTKVLNSHLQKKRGSNEREFTNRRQPGGECGKRALLTYAYFIRQRKQTWSAITIEKKPMHKQSFWLRHYLSEDVVRNKPNRIHWKMNPIESRLNYKLPAVFSFSGDYVISTYHFQKWEYFLMNPQWEQIQVSRQLIWSYSPPAV